MLTIDELQEKLLQQFEIDDIILLLQIGAEELVERFSDKLEDHQDKLRQELDDEYESLSGGESGFSED